MSLIAAAAAGTIGSIGGSALGEVLGGDGGARKARQANERRNAQVVTASQNAGARSARLFQDARRSMDERMGVLDEYLGKAEAASSGVFRQSRQDILDQAGSNSQNAIAQLAKNGILDSSSVARAQRGVQGGLATELARLDGAESGFLSNFFTNAGQIKSNAIADRANLDVQEAGLGQQQAQSLASLLNSMQTAGGQNTLAPALGQASGVLATIIGAGLGGGSSGSTAQAGGASVTPATTVDARPISAGLGLGFDTSPVPRDLRRFA